jgi:two-component system, OmpR family, sensor histidine kinase KdpD
MQPRRISGGVPWSDPGAARSVAVAALEVVVAVAAATGVIAALEGVTAASGLGSLYLLAVLAVAIRRGGVAALATAALGVLTLNFFFITPRHRLTIAHSRDVVQLIVLLIAAVVVGRLAALARQRAAEAERRARIASAREREAKLLADVASAILAGHGVEAQLQSIGTRVASATGAGSARLALGPVPSPAPGEVAIGLHARVRRAWLYLSADSGWSLDEVERLAEPLGRLIDVAVERAQVGERAAETEAAQRADVARTAILHAISHDLRSPLTAITTAGSALRGATVTDSERSELLDVIEGESVRLARLVDDLLDLSRIEAGAVAPQRDWCDLHDVVASAAGARHSEHPIEFALPADLPLIRADAAQLERVFSNLIENAIKFSPPGSPVRISGGATSGMVTVRVTDQGRGIIKSERSHVFEPFFSGRGEVRAGSGLGLSISRGFVEANGGRIVLQTGSGRGTSFAVSFPVARQPVPEPGRSPGAAGKGLPSEPPGETGILR